MKPINNEIRSLHPGASEVESGLYLIKSSYSGVNISCEKIEISLGGSHEALWSILKLFLRDVENRILLRSAEGSQEAQDAVAIIERFIGHLDSKGGAIWLTQVRNRVNYSHEYGAWFPYSGSTCDGERVVSALQRWKGPLEDIIPSQKSDELIQFSESCSFLLALIRVVISDLVFRSKANSPFRLSAGKILASAESDSG